MNPTLTSYEPPLSPDFQGPWDFWTCGDRPLALGVLGVAYEAGGLIYIPLIMAAREGSGDVGRFLDRLSARCRIISVTSARLAGMLMRRGWICEKHDVFDDIWRRCE
ncbi:MAG: hypothetical protein WBA09_22270 [Candidatus Acidiferrum sp.]